MRSKQYIAGIAAAAGAGAAVIGGVMMYRRNKGSLQVGACLVSAVHQMAGTAWLVLGVCRACIMSAQRVGRSVQSCWVPKRSPQPSPDSNALFPAGSHQHCALSRFTGTCARYSSKIASGRVCQPMCKALEASFVSRQCNVSLHVDILAAADPLCYEMLG